MILTTETHEERQPPPPIPPPAPPPQSPPPPLTPPPLVFPALVRIVVAAVPQTPPAGVVRRVRTRSSGSPRPPPAVVMRWWCWRFPPGHCGPPESAPPPNHKSMGAATEGCENNGFVFSLANVMDRVSHSVQSYGSIRLVSCIVL